MNKNLEIMMLVFISLNHDNIVTMLYEVMISTVYHFGPLHSLKIFIRNNL